MKRILTTAVLLVMICAVVLTASGCSSKGAPGINQEKIYDVTEGFDGISIISNTADITLLPSEDGECRVVSYNHKKISYSVSVENGVLTVAVIDERAWYDRCVPGIDKYYSLTLYLPKSEYASLSIEEDTGNINVPDTFKFGSIDINLSTGDTELYASATDSVRINASTGDITVKNASCGSLDASVSTGKTNLSNVISAGDISIRCSTGDVYLDNVSSKSLKSVGSTGDVTASKLTATESICIERSTGHIDIQDVTGVKLALQTTSGNIKANDVSCTDMTVSVSTGDSEIVDVDCTNFTTTGNTGDLDMTKLIASGTIDILRSTGDVNFDGCDAAEIYVITGTGSVQGSLLSAKIFLVSTDTGKINVPESTVGGKCKIKTDTGRITITIEE